MTDQKKPLIYDGENFLPIYESIFISPDFIYLIGAVPWT